MSRKAQNTMSRYTYHTQWSPEDNEYVGLCPEFPSLSWLADTAQEAIAGIKRLVTAVTADIEEKDETA
jgi:predicted RNase H-like HicB family nuclease